MATFTIHLVAGALSVLLAVGDPFAFLAPQVVLTSTDRRRLANGEIVARTLKAGAGQVGSLSIARVDVPPDALLTATRQIEDLKRSPFVSGLKRFSDPPRLEDLDELRLNPRDLAIAAACALGNCSFKLTAAEIGLLREPIHGVDRDDAIQRAFRRVVLARVNAYLAGGLAALPPTANRPSAVVFDEVFQQLAAATPALTHEPAAAKWLRDFPNANHMESFLYWSQETYGPGKPVIVVTHVGLIPPASPGAPTIVLAKQVMATRYMTGGLSLMAITTDEATGASYLINLNRTGVDMLGGFFGSFKRAALESRMRRELPDMIQKLRARLERIPPPTR